MKMHHLEQHLNRKNGGKNVVKIGQNDISVTFLLDRIFCSQCYRASNNDHHDEGVKEGIGHNGMDGHTEPLGLD